ncbi:MAG: disulfide bond corrector protein DsbC [Roseibaca calidilacus]|uniref:Disulfide bond corrector protein DsbC n=1 Tax=Roseibaca calidilacus TaxID=1666912 RepID=A0A0N8K746_9RHOB|nr:protein-disulfide reductase DsbD domain-containing protein [Roseibaca calidilacus]KPP90721.1 MAG: disulfide bond corrector protein DsbC [Roseibaca calidilacus]CUX83446.1 Disulphide bond corrector protein DsbC [Roseibaca calidilacus]
MLTLRNITGLALCAALWATAPATAQTLRPSDIVAGEIRQGWRTEDGTIMAALHLRLARNWITYWRHPGESGIPPRLDLSGSDNLAGARLHWPAPRLFTKAGYLSIGYADELVLPLELTPARRGQPIGLRMALSIGVCDDVCIPVDMDFAVALDGRGGPDRAIRQALARQPASARAAGLSDLSCEFQPARKGMHLTARWTIPQQPGDEFILLEMPDSAWRVQTMPTTRAGGQLSGQAMLHARKGQVAAIDRSAIRMTLITQDGTFEHQGCSLTR